MRGTGVGGAISRVLFDRLSTVRWSSLWGGCRQPPRAAYPQLERPGTEPRCLFGLAPTGGYRATTVAGRAVGSYPTFSPLPLDRGRSVFCVTFRRLTAPRRYLAVSPMELGLSSESPNPAATRDHPAPPIPVQQEAIGFEAPPARQEPSTPYFSRAKRRTRCQVLSFPAEAPDRRASSQNPLFSRKARGRRAAQPDGTTSRGTSSNALSTLIPLPR